jgi:DNA mismatch repair protein MutL
MTSSSEIHQLDPKTVERIAAGEVVERPASAVKELVENSIDADANRVTVAVEAGGTERIQVTDDGGGMSESALRRAVEEHTTSKISDIADLEGGVGTLGFRGEALHAIGAVSRMTITSRPRAGDSGTKLTVEGGEVTAVTPAGCPEGTTVEVEDLFYNVPARRKYLKQESTEFAHVNTVVTSYALANPDVAVTLEHDGRETFATTGTGDLQETVLAVYGREVAESMVEIQDNALPDGPLTGLRGLISHPETNRASRDYLTTFVNGRYVTAGTVRDAVVEAYGGQLGPDRYPFAVVNLELDPATVDVNVHPRKLAVRFADDEAIREQVRTAIEESLLTEGLVRSGAPRGKSAPDQTTIRPDDTSDEGDGVTESLTGQELNQTDSGTDGPGSGTGPAADSPPEQGQTAPGASRAAASASDDEGGGGDARAQDRSRPEAPAEVESPAEPLSTDSTAGDTSSAGRFNAATDRRRKFRERGTQEQFGTESAETNFESLPAMRILGQIHDTYLVAETAEGMVLIDQHAADERIHYEELRESLSGDITTQALAEPVQLSLTATEAELFAAHADALARLGFHASLVDDRTVEVTTVPAFVAETAGPELIRDVLAEFVTGEAAAADTVEAAADDLLADLACYPAITGNTSLTDGSVLDLLSTLDECENPYACPHGRPVIIEYDTDEIEARFERDYPGHE